MAITINPYAGISNNTTKDSEILTNLVEGAPADLDTLKEISAVILDNLKKLEHLELNQPEVYTKEEINAMFSTSLYEFVDLNLPSGNKWATCNIGATKPEEYGLYFAWGETQGYTGITDEKGFSSNDYKFGSRATKYNATDKLKVLELEDDAAYQTDSICKMPTLADFEELTANTTFTWEIVNGINGGKFTATNGNYIFIPAGGFYNAKPVEDLNTIGLLWSSTLATMNSFAIYFKIGSTGTSTAMHGRYCGRNVRAIQNTDAEPSIFKPKNYYTKEEIDSKGYLTEHLSLDNYALKSELPDISNLATKDEIPTDYITTIPEATIDTLGGVKKITVDTLAEDADITTVVTAYNNLISKLTEAGLVGSLII